jgi:hypothetical protein
MIKCYVCRKSVENFDARTVVIAEESSDNLAEIVHICFVCIVEIMQTNQSILIDMSGDILD